MAECIEKTTVRPEKPKADYAVGRCKPPQWANFKPGHAGYGNPNPGGKPKASRNALQGAFVRKLAADFEKFGNKAIVECRESDPGRYLSIIASIIPKEIEITQPLGELSDEQLDAAAATIRAILHAQADRADSGGSGGDEPAQVVPAVSEAG